jgi:hypothetical protein
MIPIILSPSTGASSITQYQILMGNGTSPFTGITPSTSGFILTSNGVPSYHIPYSGYRYSPLPHMLMIKVI